MAKRAHNKTSRRKAGAGGAQEALPALSSLTELPAWEELVPTNEQRAAFDAEARSLVADEPGAAGEMRMGCVVRLDRGFPAVMCAEGVVRAEFATRLTKADYSRVAVGDWVCLRLAQGHEMGLICAILPRRSDIARWRGKARGERQTLAANVDVVLVVQALGEERVQCDRLARSAVIAADCGARIAIVLTKADRAGAEMLVRDVGRIREILGDEVRLVATSSAARKSSGEKELRKAALEAGVGWGEDGVRALVPEGAIAIVLGESGAGKSTLLNALLGREALETGAVRASDDAGRHTTVARRMVSLVGAGVIVDEPGLRSLPLVGHERGLAKVFPQIAEAALECRFNDCTHTHEPGCGVREGLAEGLWPAARVEEYVALASEMRASLRGLDPDVVI